ncbi:MAG: HDIG domain-containing protein [Clostridiales bacterium]|jgi:putative nucleotidyltransferase with HDIG domain|nr:HDIG domain-containing protein [Clostridiales bacterium]
MSNIPNKRRLSLYVIVLIAVAYFSSIIVVGLGYFMPEVYDLEPGMPAPTDFTAPRQFVNSYETERLQEAAAAAVGDILFHDAAISAEIMLDLEDVISEIGVLRAQYFPIFSPADIDGIYGGEEPYLPDFWRLSIELEPYQAQHIITGDSPTFARFVDAITLQFKERLDIGLSQAALEAAPRAINDSLIDQYFDEAYASVGHAIAAAVLRQNQVVNEEMTEELRQTARDEVEPALFLQGQTIIRGGDIIDEEAYRALIEGGFIGGDGVALFVGILGTLLTVTIVFALFLFGIFLFKREMAENRRQALMLFCLYMITIAMARAMTPLEYYYTPIMLFAMLAAILIDMRLAAVLTVGVAIISAAMGPPADTMFITYALINGIFAAMIAKHIVARGRVLLAVVSLAVVNILSIFANYFMFGADFSIGMINSAAIALFVGFVTIFLTIGSLPFWESLFEVVTQNSLLELTNPNNALLRRMAVETPGTYHHSLVVANLAETASYDIGANHVLARVGSYYHDIGKMKYPQYFAENQSGENPHDTLPPRTSVEVISDHITRGLELAKQHKLPMPIKGFIEEHHGTSLMKVFFYKEKREYPDEPIDENDFRYQFTIPQSRETAVVMLADTCEAAVRSKMTGEGAKIEEMDAFVRLLIKDKLEDGQLNDSDLSIKDLDSIARAFMRVFKGMYHERVPYPSGTVRELVAGKE